MALTQGQQALRDFIVCNGSGNSADMDAFIKALSGDIVVKITPATISLPATAAAWERDALVTLETAAGERHRWFNGKIGLAIADTSTAGTAAINPAAGEYAMVDGALDVVISGNAAAWLATETATLTVNATDQDPGGGTTDYNVLGKAIAAKTCVITVV